MIKKLVLCTIVLGSFGLSITENATNEYGGTDQATLRLIEKAEILNEDILMVGNYEVSLGGIRPCCLTRKQAN
ncbi:hypothetical protein CUS95_01205 [Enterococcus faecium]|uniref:hypothetical protein n=1 Tax=Enterococcus TaxID=1350 RepID=UPI000CF2769B|nr:MULTISPECIES: hypothetical protein [Enterococcus]PQF07608.1 hypothetical protein CUS95_01205 [Enterococcus faecium]PQF21144.1 hypothetical protein CUS93_11630 [Enterococcus faecium]PQG63239.1 hypothetical protein CUS28_08830 [Enterococcus faecium]